MSLQNKRLHGFLELQIYSQQAMFCVLLESHSLVKFRNKIDNFSPAMWAPGVGSALDKNFPSLF